MYREGKSLGKSKGENERSEQYIPWKTRTRRMRRIRPSVGFPLCIILPKSCSLVFSERNTMGHRILSSPLPILLSI